MRHRLARRHWLLPLLAWFFTAMVLGSASAAENRTVLFDFEKNALGAEWTAQGSITVARGPLPEPGTDAAAPQGMGVRLEAKGPGGLYAKPRLVPGDWRAFSQVEFWAYRPPAADASTPDVVEMQLFESDGRAKFWRKVELTHQGWKQVQLPLLWFRWSEGRVPQWNRIDRLGIHMRGKGELWLDNIAVTRGKSEHEAELTPERLLPLAFPGVPVESLKIARKPEVLLVTDVEQLEVDVLAAHLAKVAKAIQADLSLSKSEGKAGTLFVFASRDAWQAFLDRFSRQLGGDPAPQHGSGFTTQGHIATAYWDPALGSLRPVFAHEFVHSYVGANLLIGNSNEWFHEGLGTMYQLRFHPQANFAKLLQSALANPGGPMPLERLCSGRPISMPNYWQAATLMEMLLKDAKHRAQVPRLIEAFQRAGSTDLGPHLRPLLDTDWDVLSTQWRAHCKTAY